MASADEMERERRRLAFLQYAASQGFSGTTPVSDIPIMTEAAGPIIPDEPDESNGGFWQSVGRNIVGAYNAVDSLYGMIRPSSPDDVRNAVAAYENIYENPEDIILEPVRSVNRVVDLAPYIDTGEEGIDYANAWRRGEGLTMGLNDILTLYALGRGAAKAPSVIGNNFTNPGARFNPYEYGIHVSKIDRGDIPYIDGRQIGQIQATAADSMPGTSYMWDATNPNTVGGIFSNPQMARVDIDPVTGNPISQFMGEEFQYPVGYFVRAPKSRTGTDINIPDSEALAVQGSQKVLEKIVLDSPQALQELLARRRVMGMTQEDARKKILENKLMPGVPEAIANRNSYIAENFIRDNIANRAPGYENYNVNMTIDEIINHPTLGKVFSNIVAGRELAAKLTQGIE